VQFSLLLLNGVGSRSTSENAMRLMILFRQYQDQPSRFAHSLILGMLHSEMHLFIAVKWHLSLFTAADWPAYLQFLFFRRLLNLLRCFLLLI
jgi:hypothetical protein